MITTNGLPFLFSNESKITFPKEKFENEKVIKIACGSSNHVLFLTENNKLFGYGDNSKGALVPLFGKNNYNDIIKLNLDSLNENEEIKTMKANYHCSFLLTTKGNLYSNGYSYYGTNGQLKDTNKYTLQNFTKIKENVKQISVGDYIVVITTFCNNYFIFGLNSFNAFGEVNEIYLDNYCIFGTNMKLNIPFIENFNVKQVECGAHCSFIVTKDNKMYCSGQFHNYSFGGKRIFVDYTELNISKLVKDWEENSQLFEFKVKSGESFTIIKSTRKKLIMKFSNDAYKICDISFLF